MTHPGLATLVMIGIGVAALYYYFRNSDYNHEYNGYQRSSQSRNNNYNSRSWSPPPQKPSENNFRRRRQHNDDSCTICMENSTEKKVVRIHPCLHQFHKQCIEDWENKGSGEAHQSCPNCRHKIFHKEEV